MKDKKRILFIAPQPFFEIRGTPIANKNMLEILSSKYKIDFLSYPIGEKIKIKNVNFYRSNSFGIKKIKIGFSIKKLILDVGLYLKTKSLIKKNNYSYIQANEESAIWASNMAKKRKIPFIYDMDSVMSEQLNLSNKKFLAKIMNFLESRVIKNSTLILGISTHFEDFCKKINSNVKYLQIWDIPQLGKKEKLDQKYKVLFDKTKKKVLYVGNKEQYQGTDIIFQLAKEMPDFQFILAGVGVDKVEGNIVQISKVPMDQVYDLMKNCDVLISPRVSGTNTPMKIYTYMASGKPIVASDIPAHNLLKDYAILVNGNEFSYKKEIVNILGQDNYFIRGKSKFYLAKYNFNNLKKIVIESYGKI